MLIVAHDSINAPYSDIDFSDFDARYPPWFYGDEEDEDDNGNGNDYVPLGGGYSSMNGRLSIEMEGYTDLIRWSYAHMRTKDEVEFMTELISQLPVCKSELDFHLLVDSLGDYLPDFEHKVYEMLYSMLDYDAMYG